MKKQIQITQAIAQLSNLPKRPVGKYDTRSSCADTFSSENDAWC